MDVEPLQDTDLGELGTIAADLADIATTAAHLRSRRDTKLRELFARGYRPADLAHVAQLSTERISHILGRPYGQRGRPPHRR